MSTRGIHDLSGAFGVFIGFNPFHAEGGAMTLSLTAVRKLTTKDEAAFLESLQPGRIEETTPARLRQKLGRARRLRDKYKDLSRRQGGQMRGKAAPTGQRPAQSNDNTLRKMELFEWAIAQIEGRLNAAG